MLHFSRIPTTLSTVRTAAFHAIGSHVGSLFTQFPEITTNYVQHRGSLINSTDIIVTNFRDLEVNCSKGLEEQQVKLSKKIKRAEGLLAISVDKNAAAMENTSNQFIEQREWENQALGRHLNWREKRHEASIDRVKAEICRLHVGSCIYSLFLTFSKFIIGLASDRSNQEETVGGKFPCTKRNRYLTESWLSNWH